MTTINKLHRPQTHEGAPAAIISAEKELRRSVMSCLLWEQSFYESGEDIAARITRLVPQVKAEIVGGLAYEARTDMNLRHVPLLLAREMARHESHRSLVADTLELIIQRPDELTEFLAIYWKDKRQPLSAQVKKGLARAFCKFDEYSLQKYNRDGAVKLRDVLFLCHAKPKDEDQLKLWKRLVNGELQTPDTWEVALSAAKDKKAEWLRLLKEDKLGALALLRNLRNMQQLGIGDDLISESLSKSNVSRVLPYRFVAAARYAPQLEPQLESKMFESISQSGQKLLGKTILLIDVSGSMDQQLSAKSDLKRLDAACALSMICREICEAVSVLTFSEALALIPPRRGFALRDAIVTSQPYLGTYLGKSLSLLEEKLPGYDRIIVITDEQSHDKVLAPSGKGYMVNVGTDKNGVGYGKWIHIDGFSESVVRFILECEKGRW